MVDEALERGIAVDATELACELGMPVVEMVAVEGRGLRNAPRRPAARPGLLGVPPMRDAQAGRRGRTHVTSAGAPRQHACRWPRCRKRCRARRGGRSPACRFSRSCSTRCICSSACSARRRWSGSSRTVVFGQLINPAAVSRRSSFVPFPLVRDFFVGDYGLITMGLTYAIAIVLPVVATFFLLFGFLEDSGYIPRLAIFSDRDLPRDGPERQGGAADGARPRLRHDGDDDDEDSGDAEGAADRDPAAGARHSLLGAAGDDPGHPRRHFVRARC